MKTFFSLGFNREKTSVLNPISIQWNKILNGVGNFTIQMKEKDYNNTNMYYVYRDGGKELGIIKKIDHSYDRTKGKLVTLSGFFMEGLLNSIPAVPWSFMRSLDSYYTNVFFQGEDEPKEYDPAIRADSYYVVYVEGDNGSKTGADRVVTACQFLSQICNHELDKYIFHYGLLDYIKPFDKVDHNHIKESALEMWDYYDENFPKYEESAVTKDYKTEVDEFGRTMFRVEKGNTSYLGDILYNWLNGYWVKNFRFENGTEVSGECPPFCPTLRCAYDPVKKDVTIEFSSKCIYRGSVIYSIERGNVESYNVTQDISNEPALGIYRAIYLDVSNPDALPEDKKEESDTPSATAEGDSTKAKNPYQRVEGWAKRDKYLDVSSLELNPMDSGKIVVETDYLGCVFDSLTTQGTYPSELRVKKAECEAEVNDKLVNFNNADTTVVYNVKPVIQDFDDDYSDHFDIGDMIRFEGKILRVVEIKEVVQNNIQSIELTLSAMPKNMMKNYYNSNHSYFDAGITR